jgi:hypothetical protein
VAATQVQRLQEVAPTARGSIRLESIHRPSPHRCVGDDTAEHRDLLRRQDGGQVHVAITPEGRDLLIGQRVRRIQVWQLFRRHFILVTVSSLALGQPQSSAGMA